MKMKLCLTQKRLKELLIYAPKTGRFSLPLAFVPDMF